MDGLSDDRSLSQSEIDALLSKLTAEGTDTESAPEQQWKVVKSYDFRRPDKLSKDQMRTLQLLHESFGRLAGSYLSAYLRTAVQLNLVSIEQGVYGEFVDRVPPDSILHILTMEPLPGNVLIGIDLTAAMAGVDRLLGGSGASEEPPPPPTEIELALIQTLISTMLRAMKDAWSRVTELSPTIRDVVLDPRYVQVALKGDPAVVIAFEMSILHRSKTVTLCIPYVVLEPILSKLNAQSWFASARQGVSGQLEQLRRNLEDTRIDVAVELGGARVSLQDLGQLKEGDVLMLDQGVDHTLDVLIGGKRKFLARPGMIGSKLAVQVVGRAEPAALQGQVA